MKQITTHRKNLTEHEFARIKSVQHVLTTIEAGRAFLRSKPTITYIYKSSSLTEYKKISQREKYNAIKSHLGGFKS